MLRVLIVDDEMLARDELAYLLKRTNDEMEINEAENIESAFDQMMDQKPDLLFLDVDLSGENGFDIAKRLKKMKHPPAIVFATAYDQYALKAFEVDALDYLTKPFDEERIQQTLKNIKSQSGYCRNRAKQPCRPAQARAICGGIDCDCGYEGHYLCRNRRWSCQCKNLRSFLYGQRYTRCD